MKFAAAAVLSCCPFEHGFSNGKEMDARSAGMVTCGVYDDTSRDCVAQIKAAADHYIHDFSQLPELPCLKN